VCEVLVFYIPTCPSSSSLFPSQPSCLYTSHLSSYDGSSIKHWLIWPRLRSWKRSLALSTTNWYGALLSLPPPPPAIIPLSEELWAVSGNLLVRCSSLSL
jgi:hypothetical protein